MVKRYSIAWLIAAPTIATIAMVCTPLPSGAKESKEDCENYANGAVQAYKVMIKAGKKCAHNNKFLWHDDFKRHYNWCRNEAKDGWRLAEQEKREDHLVKCGASSRL